jgi:hypothetical protein
MVRGRSTVHNEIDRLAERPSVRRPAREFRSGQLAAGRVLAVGLVCFLLWLIVDARQLYNASVASPIGTRRSVSMSILAPIARLNEALGLDRLVNGANRALSRDNGDTPGQASPPATTPEPTTPSTVARRASGTTGGAGAVRGHDPTTTTLVGGGLAPIRQPSPAAPLRVLDIGDSIGEDLGAGLGDVIGASKAVSLHLAAVGDTGLSNTGYYNWPVQLTRDLAQSHPDLVVALFGGNDWQPFYVGSTPAQPGSARWISAYRARVETMMREVKAAHAHLIWVGLPILGPASHIPASAAPTLNTIYASAAKASGAIYFSSYKLFENAAGQYAQYLPNASGSLVEVRDADGVHLAPPAGNDLLANHVVALVRARFHIRIP